jgi:hypothetical protein
VKPNDDARPELGSGKKLVQIIEIKVTIRMINDSNADDGSSGEEGMDDEVECDSIFPNWSITGHRQIVLQGAFLAGRNEY